jgi:hypothetical protein
MWTIWLRRLLLLLSRPARRDRRPAPRRRPPRPRLRLEGLEGRVVPATVSWSNPAGGAWNTAANWSTGHLPGAADDVVIDVPGPVTITHATGTDAVHSLTTGGTDTLVVSGGTLSIASTSPLNGPLTLSGGTISGKGELDLNAPFSWTGGTISGTGSVEVNADLVLSSTGGKTLTGRTLDDNGGTAAWSGTGGITLNAAAVWNNPAGTVLTVTGDASLSGSAGTFNNAGTLQKAAGTGTTTISTSLTNSGTIDAASGTINVAGRDITTGSFTVEAGASLAFNGGIQALEAGASVSGNGNVTFGGGNVTILGSYAVTGSTTVSSGTAAFDSDTTLPALTFSGGTLGGTGTLTVTGLLTWTGGTMTGGGHTEADGGMAISGNNDKQLSNRILDNAAEADWTGTGRILSNSNSVWNNLPGSSLIATNDAQFGGGNGSQYTGSVFNNAGTFQKAAGTGTTTVVAFVNNEGVIDAASGTLNLGDGGFNDAAMTVEAGATLGFTGGTQTLDANSSVSGPGNVTFGGADVTLNGSFAVTGGVTVSGGTADFNTGVSLAALTVSGGTLSGGGSETVFGLFTWTGGTLSGAGSTFAEGGTLISGTAGKELLNGHVLTNDATTTWTGGDINVLYDAVWNNNGLFDAQSDNRFGTDSVFHFEGTFNNYGTFQKSAGTGTTYGDIAFNNSGLVDAQSGFLDLAGGGISSGAFIAEAGGTLEFGGGPHFLTGTSSVTGNGTVIFDSETFNGLSMTITGSYDVTGTTTFRATNAPFAFPPVEFDSNATMGMLNLGGASSTLTALGNITVTGLFNWTGGTINGVGTIFAAGGMAISGSDGKTLDGSALVNAGTGTWTGTGGITASNGAIITNLPGALFDVQTDASIGGSSSLFDNQGTFRKSAGIATTTVSAYFLNEGTVDLESGNVNMSAGYTQTADGTLAVALGGASPTMYSRLQVGGLATLDGTFTVHLINGFVPASGNTFLVLNFSSGTGSFAAFDLPDLGGHTFDVTFNSTGLILTTP